MWDVLAENGSVIAAVQNHGEKAQADAAFIVTACNSHDDLLAACKLLVETIGLERVKKGVFTDVNSVTKAVEAIKKAEGGP